MHMISILSTRTGAVLFEGSFPSHRLALEAAVSDGADLRNANLRRLNLVGAMLDGAMLDQADFSASNLTGANLSEAGLTEAIFDNAALIDACLCYSDLSGSSFASTRFGATDIAGTKLDHSRFSNLSCFSIDFIQAASMHGSTYTPLNGPACPMDRPPAVIRGLLHSPIALLDRHILVGHEVFPADRLNAWAMLEVLVRKSYAKD